LTYPDNRANIPALGAGERIIFTNEPQELGAAHESEDRFDLVHARMLHFFPELVADLGGDVFTLLAGAGMGPESLTDEVPVITYRQIMQLFEAAATELSCPDFGMRLAVRQSGGGMFGPAGQVMSNSRTFGDALRYVAHNTHAHSLAARVWLRPLPQKKMIFVGHDILLEGIGDRAQAIEYILLIGHLEAMHLTDDRARARRVLFRHQPISAPRIYRRYFGCDVLFGETADGTVYSNADLARPIVKSDPQVLREVTAYIDRHFTCRRPPVHAQVRSIVLRRLASGSSGSEQVARDLKVHARTLNRRLHVEGTSFQQVKDEVRREVMLYYLQQTDIDLMDVSERLGFAEQSVMTRLCHRWFGTSPSRLRRIHRDA
jgi:AraC-like DNA-binding protein